MNYANYTVRNITQYLDNTAKNFPGKIAVSDGINTLTFSQLRHNARSVASALSELKIHKNSVLIYLEKNVSCITTFFACAYSNNYYTPIDMDMPFARINKIMQTLLPDIVVTDYCHINDVIDFCENAKYNMPILCIEDMIFHDILDDDLSTLQFATLDIDLLLVLFTSGSTGIPKGVAISHRSVIDYIEWVFSTFSITCDDVFANQAPFYFVNSILDIYSCVKTGATLHIIPKKLFLYPILLLEYLDKHNITTIFWAPSALSFAANLNALDSIEIKSLNKILFCGEAMQTKKLNIWRNKFPNAIFANIYGATEITDGCCCYIINREFKDNEPIPMGYPRDNIEILVLDEHDMLITDYDKSGELCVKGAGLAVGYYNDLEATKKVFIQNPLQNMYSEIIYRTGDIVKYNKFGELVYLCRKDFQIKHMGYRIELGEIEIATNSLSYVKNCCCIYDAEHTKIIIFVATITGLIDKKTLFSDLQKLIPAYMLPREIVFLDEIPVNANGKIDRAKLMKIN